MVKVVKALVGPDVLEEMGASGDLVYWPEGLEEPQEKTVWITCTGCGLRIPRSLICADCGENLSPRPRPEPLNKGRRLV